MRVYRVEDQQGRGPYRLNDTLRSKNGDLYDHPGPASDGSPELSLHSYSDEIRKYHFGFSSLASLGQWFHCPIINARLRRNHNCRVSVYEVDRKHVVEGNRQTIFKRRHAKLVAEYSLHKYPRLVRKVEA